MKMFTLKKEEKLKKIHSLEEENKSKRTLKR